MYKVITQCRVCHSTNLLDVLDLGEQSLTGVFPQNTNQDVSHGPLGLVWCGKCGLLQLKQSYTLDEMYGDNYGYRSGLNASMVKHLTQKIQRLEKLVNLKESDVVIDIGSNDATSLKAYKTKCIKFGVDPTGPKFKKYYTDDITLIPEFFSKELFVTESAWAKTSEKAKIITSIAMFYDLENPTQFVDDVAAVLADDGIWHLEQSYMPSMLRAKAYDTVCHEHLEFYSFRVIKNLIESRGLKVIDVQTNSINGGSFAITACKMYLNKYRVQTPYPCNNAVIDWMLRQEEEMGIDTPRPYRDFEEKVYRHRKSLVDLIDSLVAEGKRIFGYGASTKGNVMLQWCGLGPEQIECIADVNPDKFGCFTPGTHIPIISEEEARAEKPDYFIVFPWHFKQSILEREKEYTEAGGKFIFPLPEVEIV